MGPSARAALYAVLVHCVRGAREEVGLDFKYCKPASNKFFDSSTLLCTSCSTYVTNEEASADHVATIVDARSHLLDQFGQSHRCTCPTRTVAQELSCSRDMRPCADSQCVRDTTLCPAPTVPMVDGRCTRCGSGGAGTNASKVDAAFVTDAVLNVAAHKCECPSSNFMVQRPPLAHCQL